MDPRRSPLWVLFALPSDEIAQLASDLWPPCPLPRFPTPERRETRTMPAKDGLRLNDMRRPEQASPEPRQPHHQGPVTAAQSKARRRTPQGDAELMAKEQVLGFKSARRLEEVNNEHCERIQDREHRPRSCDDFSRRCDSQAGWNFRKGQGVFMLKNLCIWNKTNGGMGSLYRSKHELVFVFKAGMAAHTNPSVPATPAGTRTQCMGLCRGQHAGGSLLRGTGRHSQPGQPVAMVADAIRDCSRRGEIVLDPFGGSGAR